MEPRIDTNEHELSGIYAKPLTHLSDESHQFHSHSCPSVSIRGFSRSSAVFRLSGYPSARCWLPLGAFPGMLANRRRFMSKGAPKDYTVKACALTLVGGCLFWCGGRRAPAPPGAAPGNNAPPARAAATNATAISLAEIATQAEEASANLETIETDLSADRTTRTIEPDLPVITSEISSRLEENSRMLARNPSLQSLRRLEGEWQEIRDELSGWKRSLTKRETQIAAETTRLSQMDKTWEMTRESEQNSTAPQEVAQRINTVIASIKETQGHVAARQAEILKLLNRVTE